jgi:leader peptidase (prepilin peptidase) / N-methyltransferase
MTIAGVGMGMFCFLLLGLAVMDAETMRLPDAFTWTGLGAGVLWSGSMWLVAKEFPPALRLPGGIGVFDSTALAHHSLDWRVATVGLVSSLLWAFLAALVMLLIRGAYWLVRRREGMGLGDVKLLAMIAAWLGPTMTLLTLFLGVVAAAVLGGLWMLVRGRRGAMAMRLPLGSFLCAAALYAIFAGEPILEWYMKFFH